jgi:hypothetical protein
VESEVRDFLEWLNNRMVAPWVIAIATAIYGFAKWETTVKAQGEHIKTIEESTEQKFHAMENSVLRAIERLETKQDAVARDVAIVCARVRGSCKNF